MAASEGVVIGPEPSEEICRYRLGVLGRDPVTTSCQSAALARRSIRRALHRAPEHDVLGAGQPGRTNPSGRPSYSGRLGHGLGLRSKGRP